MAVSTYTTNLTDIYAGAGSTTNWTALGGGASGLNAETDYFIQGTGMTSKNAFASARKGMIYNSGSDRASTIGTDGAVLIWTTHTTPNSLDTIANGGITALVGSSTSDYKHWYVGGSDTIEFLGWILAAVNPSETTDEADAGTPSAVEQYFGILFDLPSGGPTKGAPNAIDAIRAGRCDLIYEFGTSTDPDATFDLAVADKGDVTDRLGLIQEVNGSFFCSGLHQLGSSTNVVNFTDSNKTMFWRDHPAVTAPFNTLEIQNASSTVDMTNISWKALGTKSPGTWTTTDNATVNLITCNFIDWGDFTFLSNTTVDTCNFLGCGQITTNNAVLNGSSVAGYEGTAGTAALIWNNVADPDGNLDDMTFTKGTAATHAIEFTSAAPLTSTLRNVTTSGYNAADGNNDSTLLFADRGSDVTWTVNVIGGTGNFSFRKARAGDTVNIVIDPVTTKFTVQELDGTKIQNARVFVETNDNGGGSGFPYQAATSSLTQTAGTATCTTSVAHGLATNDQVVIRGASDELYNKVATITVTSTTVFTYTVDSGAAASAGGTPVVSYVPIHGLTDVNGEISTSKTWPASQSLTGWARKSTSAPYFKQSAISVADASGGTDATITLLSDE